GLTEDYVTKALGKEDVRYLLLLGGFCDFVTQRCQYLFEHPDGASGKAVSTSHGTLELGVLLRGALMDLFAEISVWKPSGTEDIADFDMPAPTELTVGFRLMSNKEPIGTGAVLLKMLVRSTKLIEGPHGAEWRVDLDAKSLRSGLADASQHMHYLRL